MTLQEKARKYNMGEGELKDFLLSDSKNVRFFKNHSLNGNLDPVADRAIDEIMTKAGKLPSSDSSAFMNEPVDENVESNPVESDNENSGDNDSKLDNETGNETEDVDAMILGNTRAGMGMSQAVQEAEEPKSKRTNTRSRKKPASTVEVESQIDVVPSMVLRKFYAENFSVKPEKIFFMDDASVKEKIDEKYVVMERDNDYLFIKRTAAIISVKKE